MDCTKGFEQSVTALVHPMIQPEQILVQFGSGLNVKISLFLSE